MYTRRGSKTAFDSIALVELKAAQSPSEPSPCFSGKICYISSETGHTYGAIDFAHNEGQGLSMVSAETLEAWKKFVALLEKDQGGILFDLGSSDQLDMFDDEGGKAELNTPIGLGGVR